MCGGDAGETPSKHWKQRVEDACGIAGHILDVGHDWQLKKRLVMKSVPHFLKRPFYNALRLALEEVARQVPIVCQMMNKQQLHVGGDAVKLWESCRPPGRLWRVRRWRQAPERRHSVHPSASGQEGF